MQVKKKNNLLFFSGIDIGASHTKLVFLDINGKLIGYSIRKSGTDLNFTSRSTLSDLLLYLNLDENNMLFSVATGYGRKNVEYADKILTEISSHAKGCYSNFPFSIDIIDIGGQDNKVIKLDDNGKLIGFKMNRKCASGTGAFLEEISFKLNIKLDKLNDMAVNAKSLINLGSYCTVFSATEVLEKIRLGIDIKNIVKGVFFSILKRIVEMDSFSSNVVLTGGVVANNLYLIKMINNMLNESRILLPQFPQFTGAFGAALSAID